MRMTYPSLRRIVYCGGMRASKIEIKWNVIPFQCLESAEGFREFFPREESENAPDIFRLKSDCMATRQSIEVALSLKSAACLLKNREKFLRAKKQGTRYHSDLK